MNNMISNIIFAFQTELSIESTIDTCYQLKGTFIGKELQFPTLKLNTCLSHIFIQIAKTVLCLIYLSHVVHGWLTTDITYRM